LTSPVGDHHTRSSTGDPGQAMSEADIGRRDGRGNLWPLELLATPPLFV